jgi:hypothetical protein
MRFLSLIHVAEYATLQEKDRSIDAWEGAIGGAAQREGLPTLLYFAIVVYDMHTRLLWNACSASITSDQIVNYLYLFTVSLLRLYVLLF